jgi:hypothetical protein
VTAPSGAGVDLRAFSLVARARRLAALMKKEALQIVRDPSSILIAFVLPVILLFLFGYGVSLDTTRTSIGVVLESPSPTSRGLAAAFQASPDFDTSIGVDRREFEDLASSCARNGNQSGRGARLPICPARKRAKAASSCDRSLMMNGPWATIGSRISAPESMTNWPGCAPSNVTRPAPP